MINEGTKLLLNSENLSQTIDVFLTVIREETGVDRIYIFKEKTGPQGESLIDQINEVCAEGIEPQIDNPDLSNFPWVDYTPRWYNQFNESLPIVGHIADYPEDERAILEPQDIQSLLAVPIRFKKRLMGFVGLDSVRERRDWDEHEISLLQSVASVIGALWQREEKEAETRAAYERVQQSEETFRVFAENLSDAIWIRKLGTGEAIFQNKATETIYGVSPEDYASDANGFLDFIPEEDRPRIYAKHQEYLKGKPFEEEHRIRRKDGEIRWVNAKGFRIHSSNGPDLLAGVVRDVTERKRVLSEVTKARDKAEELSRLKTALMTSISHEFRTPVTGIVGFASLLRDNLQHDPKGLEYLTFIENSVTRLSNTLEAIMEYSVIDSKNVENFPRAIQVSKALSDYVDQYRSKAHAKDLYLQVEWPSHDAIVVDPVILKIILKHLLDNSIKFTSVGGIRIVFKVEGGELVLSVKDSGIGIPKAMMSSIFEVFRQGSEGMSRMFEGNGLGLSIVNKYIDYLNGSVSVDSVEGEQTTFTIRIPVTVIEQSGESPKSDFKRILYIEDDAMIQMLAKRSLTRYDVVTYFSAESALEHIVNDSYDAVLLDVNLGGGMSGVALCKLIRLLPNLKTVPIAAITASGLDPDESYYQAGFSHYLPKPFDSNQLIAFVDDMVRTEVQSN
jgi:PAS domain S-box-containing protein